MKKNYAIELLKMNQKQLKPRVKKSKEHSESRLLRKDSVKAFKKLHEEQSSMLNDINDAIAVLSARRKINRLTKNVFPVNYKNPFDKSKKI